MNVDNIDEMNEMELQVYIVSLRRSIDNTVDWNKELELTKLVNKAEEKVICFKREALKT